MSVDCKTIFNADEQKQLVRAIADAEQNTSGEIRIHLEDYCDGEPYHRGLEVFHSLKMHQTALKNGVLIYIAVQDRKLAILCDKGINDIVPPHYWEEILQALKTSFKRDQFLAGIEQAIHEIGQKLKIHFPYQKNDIDELTNENSIGKVS